MSAPGFQHKIRTNAQKFEFQAEVGTRGGGGVSQDCVCVGGVQGGCPVRKRGGGNPAVWQLCYLKWTNVVTFWTRQRTEVLSSRRRWVGAWVGFWGGGHSSGWLGWGGKVGWSTDAQWQEGGGSLQCAAQVLDKNSPINALLHQADRTLRVHHCLKSPSPPPMHLPSHHIQSCCDMRCCAPPPPSFIVFSSPTLLMCCAMHALCPQVNRLIDFSIHSLYSNKDISMALVLNCWMNNQQ
jgi:hypothetical protein